MVFNIGELSYGTKWNGNGRKEELSMNNMPKYFDTAYVYHGGMSERAVQEAARVFDK